VKRRGFLASLAAAPLFGTHCTLALAAAPHRLGCLLAGARESDLNKLFGEGPSLRDALVNLDYVEGRNLSIEWRFFEADRARASSMAADLVRLGADALVTTGTPWTKVLQGLTKTIPIVTIVDDPVAGGFTTSLVRPEGNITGLMLRHPDTPAKQVELFRRVLPKLDRLVIIGNARYTGSREIMRPYGAAASATGLVPDVEIVDIAAIERIFSEMKSAPARAALVALGQFTSQNADQVARLAIRHGVATMSTRSGYVELGGLMTFSMYHSQPYSRWASIIDKIFRGVKPADIPWELPDRSHFAINLGTAKALGLTISPDLLLRADQVIE
jgi:putative tryptophan/tyrosine transport system substrate-binding protein